jgi:hypothetical protein
VTGQTIWQCPTCGEQHEGQFDTCWKCGTNRTGRRNQNFHVSEAASENVQSLDSADDVQLPTLQLPTITYLSIPPFIWISLANMFNRLQRGPNIPQISDFSIPTAEIVVDVLACVLIGIPCFFTMARFMFLCIMRRQKWAPEVTWILSMFRLPVNLCQQHSWFVPLYYGSIVAMFIVQFGFTVWHLASTI